MSKSFIDFYQALLTTRVVNDAEECLLGLEVWVTEEMNCQLLKVFFMDKVDVTLKQMHLLKSSGHDGMSACFY